MKEYDHNKREPIEYNDLLFWFGWILFIGALLILLIELQRNSEQLDEIKEERHKIYDYRGVIGSSNKKDTIIIYPKTYHINPITGTIDHFFGEK